MKSYLTTSKGFKVIPVNLVEIQKFGTVAPVCDSCNVSLLFGGTFIPVLGNRTYCDNCYKEWHETAINYPQDHSYEAMALDRALKVLNRITKEDIIKVLLNHFEKCEPLLYNSIFNVVEFSIWINGNKYSANLNDIENISDLESAVANFKKNLNNYLKNDKPDL